VLTAHTGTVRTIAVSSAEDLLLSGSHDGTACVYRILDDGLVCLQTLRGHEGVIFCVTFAGDEDSQVVTAGIDASIRVWDLEDG
jgi:F-box and WD-40 domain protein CDC4